MLADRATIQDTQVGCEIEDLKPTTAHAAADGLLDPSEDVPPLPYQSAAEFGFTTEDIAQFIGLQCVVDAELFVPVFEVEHCENQAEGGCGGFMHVHIGV